MIHKDYICAVLARFEGKGIPRGYVPCEGSNYTGVGKWEGKIPLGVSGVTIGTGFDLGQQSRESLRAMGLAPALREKLTPYLGCRKKAALEQLYARPLVLTAEEVKELDDAVHEKYISQAVGLFGMELFTAAPQQAQAVAVSLHYQFGTPFRDASPNLGKAWGSLRSGRYADAATYLRNSDGWSVSHQKYMPRRRAEAALLDEIGRG